MYGHGKKKKKKEKDKKDKEKRHKKKEKENKKKIKQRRKKKTVPSQGIVGPPRNRLRLLALCVVEYLLFFCGNCHR
jgi:hypothetical protein